jgi:hypothetical protein
MLAGNVFVAIAGSAVKKKEPIPEWPLYLLGISLTLMVGGFFYRKFDFGLRLTRSHEGGFWKRNAEKIALTLVGAAIGAVMTWLSKAFGR